jgi:(E)-4-hydroxy-3-methylbut-2-enyl-diphosphate synthase
MGIGTLLEDGLGDTVRVSLTEDPEFEAPVAKALVDRYIQKAGNFDLENFESLPFDPYSYKRKSSRVVSNFGGSQVPRVIADYSAVDAVKIDDLKAIGHFYLPLPDKWAMNDLGADYIYSGKSPISFMLPNGLREIVDFDVWKNLSNTQYKYPLFELKNIENGEEIISEIQFLKLKSTELNAFIALKSKVPQSTVLIIESERENSYPDFRLAYHQLKKIDFPIVLHKKYENIEKEDVQLFASTDVGGILVDGFGDGIMLSYDDKSVANSLSFGILQAARTRMSKTEYISCPSCGRTLFDLQETTAMIRKRTDHLKGVKIGIMGCIVNGPGEMADADYGYVGIGKDKISLYKGQEVVKRSVNSQNAVDELIELIKEDGKWLEPPTEVLV